MKVFLNINFNSARTLITNIAINNPSRPIFFVKDFHSYFLFFLFSNVDNVDTLRKINGEVQDIGMFAYFFHALVIFALASLPECFI